MPKHSPGNAGTWRERAGVCPHVPLLQPAPAPFQLFPCNLQLFLCSSACKDPCKPPQHAASSAGLTLERGVPWELVTTGTSVKCFI